jgi:hypothetical protein
MESVQPAANDYLRRLPRCKKYAVWRVAWVRLEVEVVGRGYKLGATPSTATPTFNRRRFADFHRPLLVKKIATSRVKSFKELT